jgi:hypothetical protein
MKLSAKTKVLESFMPMMMIFTGLLYHLSGIQHSNLLGKLQGAAMCLQILILSSVAHLGYICCSDLQERFCHINNAIGKLQEVLK